MGSPVVCLSNMTLHGEGVCLLVLCDRSILSLPYLLDKFRKLAVKLTGTQSNSAVDQTAKNSSEFRKVCSLQV